MQAGAPSDRTWGDGEGNRIRQPDPTWKRVLDLALILASAPLSLLVAFAIMLFIKFSSPGPVIFRQQRIGYRGRRFVCLKFRTMRVDADHSAHRNYLHQLMQSQTPMTKMDVQGDPRLIPFGAALRATGLDELPQLVNILRGEMSLVGPRPCLPYEYEQYTDHQKRRFEALPGLTGLWQVSGKNRTTFNEMIQLDISYAEFKSLWLDLKIIARTIPALISQLVEIRIASRRVVPPRVERAT
jgi:lipopolysaccharide/colanic/teichoic acid biosynthesis glycosyltransferase